MKISTQAQASLNKAGQFISEHKKEVALAALAVAFVALTAIAGVGVILSIVYAATHAPAFAIGHPGDVLEIVQISVESLCFFAGMVMADLTMKELIREFETKKRAREASEFIEMLPMPHAAHVRPPLPTHFPLDV